MLISSQESSQLARLFGLLAAGEQIAADCARRQARLARDRSMRRFLKAQALQESTHALIFRGAASRLDGKGGARRQSLRPLERYRGYLERSLERGDLVESLLGQQVILEELGEVILVTLDRGMENRGLGLRSLRRMILRQEHAHHHFGARRLEAECAAGRVSPSELRVKAEGYLALVDEMLSGHAAIFEALREDPDEYDREFYRGLPEWLHPETGRT